MRARGGQVALFLIMTLVVVFLIALMNVDAFVAVRAKNRLQNGGDAAAIAAARRQGELLNEIGRLNLDHMAAAILNMEEMCEGVVALQRRLALLGPVDALRLANEAALKNGMERRADFAAILGEHVATIRTMYSGGGDGDPYPEPYPGAWTEYAAAIENVVAGGLATGPDNMEFYDAASGHLLLMRQFYNAIAGRDWCWFHFNAANVLRSYGSYRDWGPVPTRRDETMDNSEIFSLHVVARRCALTSILSEEQVLDLLLRTGGRALSMLGSQNRAALKELVKNSELISDPDQVWFMYDSVAWRKWFDGLALDGDEDGYQFPIVGSVKPEYNVRGCAAICRCASRVTMSATDMASDLTWSAAAKPFGTLENLDGETDCANSICNIVLPCFTDVRLVPVDAVGGEDLATADFGWVNHVRHHLGPYLERGPAGLHGCTYCQLLQVWETAEFRQEGVKWLQYNAGSCVRGSGGPGGRGGTSHGH